MPRISYPYKPPSKAAIRMRVHRLLKRLDKQQQQSERLRSEGGAGTSYSVRALPRPAEQVVTEGAIDDDYQSVPNTDRPQAEISEGWVDDTQFFRRWVSKYGISQTALAALLCHFRTTHRSLPVDPRTLMTTPGAADLRVISPAMDTQNPYYIVATIPESGNDIVLLSSTWVIDECSDQDLRTTQMPSVRSHKFYEAVKKHTPCQPGDKKYTFKEIDRTISFSYARELELRYFIESTPISDGIVHMGLPPNREIRSVLSEEDENTVQKQPNCPAHVKCEPPEADTCNILIQAPCSNNSHPILSTSEDSSAFHLIEIKNMFNEVLSQVKRTAALVAHVSERCKNIEQLLETMCAENNKAEVSKSICANVPAHTMEQVIALDTQLQEEEVYRQLSDQFLGIPGGDLRTLVRNILTRLISPAISEEIHCTGKNRPFTFKNSRLHGFLLDQVSRRSEFATVDPKTVGYEARLWFKLRREQKKGKTQEAVVLPVGKEEDDLLSEEWEESAGSNAELRYAYP